MPYPPADPGRPTAWGSDDLRQTRPFEAFFVPSLRPKFRHRWWLHILLFVLTLLSTTVLGAGHYLSYISEFGRRPIELGWALFLPSLYYSLSILAILGAHEMGHYLACRRYNVDATLPYFVPAPIILTGTLGAVIRIKEPFPTRRVLFDIAIAGPIAGFVMLIPVLAYGMTLSELAPSPTGPGVYEMGEPLLFQWAAALKFDTIPPGHTINMHPMVFAAWFGMLATALNLLPFGQLDGGHITYATVGRWSVRISLATVLTAILLTLNSLSWLLFTVLMLVMLLLFGPRHPRVIYEDEPLPASRYALAILALIIFIVCFTPVPIDPFISERP